MMKLVPEYSLLCSSVGLRGSAYAYHWQTDRLKVPTPISKGLCFPCTQTRPALPTLSTQVVARTRKCFKIKMLNSHLISHQVIIIVCENITTNWTKSTICNLEPDDADHHFFAWLFYCVEARIIGPVRLKPNRINYERIYWIPNSNAKSNSRDGCIMRFLNSFFNYSQLLKVWDTERFYHHHLVIGLTYFWI
jgi:hypothetical protein